MLVTGVAGQVARVLAERGLEHGIAVSTIGRPVLDLADPDCVLDALGPQGIYANYKRRRVNAHHRLITGLPGPKKAAEEYVMIALLRAEGA